jgi:hypothetical protein
MSVTPSRSCFKTLNYSSTDFKFPHQKPVNLFTRYVLREKLRLLSEKAKTIFANGGYSIVAMVEILLYICYKVFSC